MSTLANILVVAEHDHGALKSATLSTVTAAVELSKMSGGEVHVLVVGHNTRSAADAAARVAGVAQVLLADAPQLAEQLGENVAAQVLAMAADYGHILFPATAHGKNAAPRVAARLDVAQVSDATRVIDRDTFERPIYAGNAIATVQSVDKVKVITVRSGRQRQERLRQRRDRKERSPRAGGGQNRRFRRARYGLVGKVH